MKTPVIYTAEEANDLMGHLQTCLLNAFYNRFSGLIKAFKEAGGDYLLDSQLQDMSNVFAADDNAEADERPQMYGADNDEDFCVAGRSREFNTLDEILETQFDHVYIDGVEVLHWVDGEGYVCSNN